MRTKVMSILGILVCAVAMTISGKAQTDSGVPQLQKKGNATQLIVDGKPFLVLSGELMNNAGTSLENMDHIWPLLVHGNLNTVLIGVSWAQTEPEEGKFDFSRVDGLIAKARENNLHVIFLWFAAWKNATSSYPPYWMKKDYVRFPRIQINDGQTVSVSGPVELLSTFGDATRDAESKAFGALMAHIKEVDGAQHTVLMIQVENEMGVLRDTRDRSPAANRAYAGQVPTELMNYMLAHKGHLIPEFEAVWAANGYKTSGTWEQVFGPGKPADVVIPIKTTSPPIGVLEQENTWQDLHWPSDEFFMAWNYARYMEKVIEAGKAGYNIPMFVNGWEQQPGMPWPGTYPSGGPLPQVHDVWRAGAPSVDIFAPDLYLPYFDEICARWIRNGNPLYMPESPSRPANAIMDVGKFNGIGMSVMGIEKGGGMGGDVGPSPELAATYGMLNNLAPLILAHQGDDTMTAVRMKDGDPHMKVKLGSYTLDLTYTGRIDFVPPGPKDQPIPPQPPGQPSLEAAAVFISTGPDEFYIGGGGMRVEFAANTPGPPNVGLGDVEEGRFVDGHWKVNRVRSGDDTAEGEILILHPDTILHLTLYRFP
jgi:hypothetical protein